MDKLIYIADDDDNIRNLLKSFLERESEPNFRLAGDKIKQLRVKYGVQALLLEHNEDKNLILLSPKKVKVINKG